MKLQTKYVGEVDIEDASRIEFPFGLPGFIEETEFVLLDIPGNAVFQTLQSTTSQNLAFIVTNPYHFYQAYEFELENNVLESLQIKEEKEVLILAIVTLKNPFPESTINLKAPLILNTTLNTGKQYILNIDDYPTKASIAPPEDLKAGGE